MPRSADDKVAAVSGEPARSDAEHSGPTRGPAFDAFQAMARDLARNQNALREAIQRSVRPSLQWSERLREQIEANRKSLIEPVLRAAAAIREQMREALPANWRQLDSDAFGAVVKLAEQGVVSVVWAPRAEITHKLAMAEDQPARERILAGHRQEILDDVAELLEASTVSRVPEQDEAREQAIEALAAARAGFDRAAQSLFASALGHILEGSLGFERPGKAFKAFKERDLDEAIIGELRVVCLQLATANSLTDTDENPDGFNRHGTQHGSPRWFSDASMIAGALLIAGWIGELSWLADNRPEVFGEE